MLAFDQYKESNRFPKVKLYIEDDGFNALKGLSSYRKLTEVEGVQAFPNGTSTTIGAISNLVRKRDLPVIQLGEETEDPINDNILQISPGGIELERALGRYLLNKYPEDLVLFYTVNSTMLRFVDAFTSGYGHPLSSYQMDSALQDLRPLIIKALKQKPACIVILSFPAQGALLVKNIRDLGGKDIRLAFDANLQTGLADYQRLLGNLEFLNEATVAVLKLETSADFKKAYFEKYGESPGVTADLGYDAFNLLVDTYDPKVLSWLSKLKKGSLKGASGAVVFDSVGIRKPEFDIATVADLLRQNQIDQ